ncbi:MAG: hypothetical protein EB060_12040 [Proteobacteria bacterium]|nr:hypothetical protein [Pseudomonadota bacterium]
MIPHTTHFSGCDCVMDKIQKLEAENARLRNALVMIIEGTDNKYPHPCSLDHEEINGISREALAELKGND